MTACHGVITAASGVPLSSNVYVTLDVLQFSTGGRLSLYVGEVIHSLHLGTNIVVLGQEVYVADRAVSLTSRTRAAKPAPSKHHETIWCWIACEINKYLAGWLLGRHCCGIGVGVGNVIGKVVGGYPCRSAQSDRLKGWLAKLTACKKSGRWGHGQPHYSN